VRNQLIPFPAGSYREKYPTHPDDISTEITRIIWKKLQDGTAPTTLEGET